MRDCRLKVRTVYRTHDIQIPHGTARYVQYNKERFIVLTPQTVNRSMSSSFVTGQVISPASIDFAINISVPILDDSLTTLKQLILCMFSIFYRILLLNNSGVGRRYSKRCGIGKRLCHLPQCSGFIVPSWLHVETSPR